MPLLQKQSTSRVGVFPAQARRSECPFGPCPARCVPSVSHTPPPPPTARAEARPWETGSPAPFPGWAVPQLTLKRHDAGCRNFRNLLVCRRNACLRRHSITRPREGSRLQRLPYQSSCVHFQCVPSAIPRACEGRPRAACARRQGTGTTGGMNRGQPLAPGPPLLIPLVRSTHWQALCGPQTTQLSVFVIRLSE